MRILIIEDEEKLAKSFAQGLSRSGYAADYVLDGESGERRIELHHDDYDLITLDLVLPGKSGFEVCETLRAKGITTPIIVLSARDTTEDRVRALNAGADDFLVKPFAFKELLARITAILRRPREALKTELQAKNVTLKPAEREVYRDGERVDLTLKEFELLYYLMRNPGKVLSREDIYVHLWDFADNAMSNVIDVHMKNLRRKIGDTDTDGKIVETVRGVGYRLQA